MFVYFYHEYYTRLTLEITLILDAQPAPLWLWRFRKVLLALSKRIRSRPFSESPLVIRVMIAESFCGVLLAYLSRWTSSITLPPQCEQLHSTKSLQSWLGLVSGENLRIVNTTMTVGRRVASARTEVRCSLFGFCRQSSSAHFLDLERNAPSTRGFRSSYKNGT